MNSGAITRSRAACGSMVTAAALAAGLVAVPVEVRATALPRIESHQVQLHALTASAALGSAGPKTEQLTPSDVVPTAVGTANDEFAAGLATALETIGRAAVDVAGLVLAPVWYVAFPITFQMASAYLDTIDSSYYNFPDLTGLVGLLRLGRVIGIWLDFPLRASSYLFPTPPAMAQPSAAAAAPEGTRAVNPVVRPETRAADAAGDQDQMQESDRIPPERPRTHHPRRDASPTSHRAARAASEATSASAGTTQDGVNGDARASATSAGRSLSSQTRSDPSIVRTDRGSGIAGSQSGAGTGVP